MEQMDTINLLKECDSGTKMAVSSIDEVLDRVEQTELKGLLADTRDHHARLGDEIHEELNRRHAEDKDPNPMAKGMSWIKTNMKLTMDASDSMIADLIVDGCDMGVKSLTRYRNQYSDADHTSRDLCERLISIEEQLSRDLRPYL